MAEKPSQIDIPYKQAIMMHTAGHKFINILTDILTYEQCNYHGGRLEQWPLLFSLCTGASLYAPYSLLLISN